MSEIKMSTLEITSDSSHICDRDRFPSVLHMKGDSVSHMNFKVLFVTYAKLTALLLQI